MGKPTKRHRKQKYDYSKDRRKAWLKSKKLPNIECKQIKQAWNSKKSLQWNMKEMGISVDPNKTLKIPGTKEMIPGGKSNKSDNLSSEKKMTKSHVVKELEQEASLPLEKTMKLSEEEVKYCTYMMDKYGEDYKAMARDRRNYYQDTPKQIRQKIRLFKSIPQQYSAYMLTRSQDGPKHGGLEEEGKDSHGDPPSTPCSLPVTMVIRTRQATRSYRAKRRNGHYLTPPGSPGVPRTTGVPLYHVRRKLNFGRKPPTPRYMPQIATTSKKGQKRKADTKVSGVQKLPQRQSKRNKMSRELLKLMEMTPNSLLPERLRSSRKYSQGDHKRRSSTGCTIHSSPEHTNLKELHGRQH